MEKEKYIQKKIILYIKVILKKGNIMVKDVYIHH